MPDIHKRIHVFNPAYSHDPVHLLLYNILYNVLIIIKHTENENPDYMDYIERLYTEEKIIAYPAFYCIRKRIKFQTVTNYKIFFYCIINCIKNQKDSIFLIDIIRSYFILYVICVTKGENPGKIPRFSTRNTGVGRNLHKFDVLAGYKLFPALLDLGCGRSQRCNNPDIL